MRYLSLFSGIEAASVAWMPLGWEPVGFSENASFPAAVLKAHYRSIPNFGDIRTIDWRKHEQCLSADIIVGGSPCQSFSFAGTRTGLRGSSGLMWEYVRAVRKIRPRWLLWENVPGALSSSRGEDFRCLLQSLDDLGYGLAWRVLDAQYFGVAQRRRRLYLVGSLGDERAGEVLFERESLRWDYPTCREERKIIAERMRGSIGDKDQEYSSPGCAESCSVSGNGGRNLQESSGNADILQGCESCSEPAVYEISGNAIGRVSRINGGHHLGVCNPDSTGAYTLTATDRHAVCIPCPQHVDRECGSPIVRYLTPVEYERLQGFPDGWTDVPYRGHDHAPDSSRYKALGNSMAVPVMRWIGQRIQHADMAA